MEPLIIQDTTIKTKDPVVQYRGLSNLKMRAYRNQSDFIKQNLLKKQFILNQHPLVKLLSFMNIDRSWTYDYLTLMIDLKSESWASQLNLTSVHNKGKGYRNIFYKDNFYELLILAPPSYSYEDFLNIPDEQLCPIIPIYTTDNHFDYVTVNEIPDSHNGYKGYAVIAVDLAALAIGFWRFLNNNLSEYRGIGYYLYGHPLLNAKILSNRLTIINTLFQLKLKDGNPLIKIRASKIPMMNIADELKKYVNFNNETLSSIKVRSVYHLLEQLGTLDTLAFNNLLLNPGKYRHYSQTNWAWQLPTMQLYALIRMYNKPNGFSDSIQGNIIKWAKTPFTYWTSNIPDASFRKHYEELGHLIIAST